MPQNTGLFDDMLIQPEEPTVKSLVKKTKSKKSAKKESDITEIDKMLKSGKVSIKEKLDIVEKNVFKVLGKQRTNILTIRDLDTFKKYIDKAIEKKIIAVDTETTGENTLDPITAKLLGLCLYTPGEQQAYIPVNHLDLDGNLLPNQLTEQDCRKQLQRLVDAHTYILMHNGKFDYKVIKCTCNIEVKPNWDTLIAAKLLNENENDAGLKAQYIQKIDPTQEKYSLDNLFSTVNWAQVKPDIFAYYAATDSLMTYKLYEWQKPRLEAYKDKPSGHGKSLYDLFTEVEMPCVVSTAEMELTGVCFDKDLAQRLKKTFDEKLAEIDNKINILLDEYKPVIKEWRANPENIAPARVYVSNKTKMSKQKIEQQYPNIDEKGNRYKIGKSKVDQLEDPINLASPAQLAILLYDILGCDNNGDRSTGDEALKELSTPFAKLLLERRGTKKLLDAFIISLPETVNPKTGKIHCSFNQYGAKTGRFSSSEPNLQQIPAKKTEGKALRLLFTARVDNHKIDLQDNYYEVDEGDEVETTAGWKKVNELVIGDIILGDSNTETIKQIKQTNDKFLLYV